jgi:hypothetical protein
MSAKWVSKSSFTPPRSAPRKEESLLECLKLEGPRIQDKHGLIQLQPLWTSFFQFSNHFPVAGMSIVQKTYTTRIKRLPTLKNSHSHF